MSSSGISQVAVHGVDEPLADLEALVRRLRDARLVVRQADDGRPVLLDERQNPLEPVVLARDRVDERLALVHLETGLERLDDRRVDADRQVGVLLHEPDRTPEQVGLVGQRDAHVDVEHVGAARDLILDVRDDLGQVACSQRLGERLAAGRVDALADDAERLVAADDDLARP